VGPKSYQIGGKFFFKLTMFFSAMNYPISNAEIVKIPKIKFSRALAKFVSKKNKPSEASNRERN